MYYQVSNTAAATTAMLLTVSFYVIATTLPATVVYVLEESFPQGSVDLTDAEIAVDECWQRFFRYMTVRRITEEVCATALGAVQRKGGRGTTPSKNSAPTCGPPMKFMIKHNLPLVSGGLLWQYRSVPHSCNYGHPLPPPPNVNPRTATATVRQS